MNFNNLGSIIAVPAPIIGRESTFVVHDLHRITVALASGRRNGQPFMFFDKGRNQLASLLMRDAEPTLEGVALMLVTACFQHRNYITNILDLKRDFSQIKGVKASQEVRDQRKIGEVFGL